MFDATFTPGSSAAEIDAALREVCPNPSQLLHEFHYLFGIDLAHVKTFATHTTKDNVNRQTFLTAKAIEKLGATEFPFVALPEFTVQKLLVRILRTDFGVSTCHPLALPLHQPLLHTTYTCTCIQHELVVINHITHTGQTH